MSFEELAPFRPPVAQSDHADGAAITGGYVYHGPLDRAHLRLGYDERTGDLFLLTKGDGMIRKVTAACNR